jgi:hypothetical protein
LQYVAVRGRRVMPRLGQDEKVQFYQPIRGRPRSADPPP